MGGEGGGGGRSHHAGVKMISAACVGVQQKLGRGHRPLSTEFSPSISAPGSNLTTRPCSLLQGRQAQENRIGVRCPAQNSGHK